METTAFAYFALSAIASLYYSRQHQNDSQSTVLYSGQCHCGKVKFECLAPRHLVVWDCDCSICLMKKNWHFIIPQRSFRFISGEEELSTYQFNTKVAKHMFCKHCGVQAFYRPRSNPDGYAVTFACINPKQVKSYEVVPYNGQNWEKFYVNSGIQKFSK